MKVLLIPGAHIRSRVARPMSRFGPLLFDLRLRELGMVSIGKRNFWVARLLS